MNTQTGRCDTCTGYCDTIVTMVNQGASMLPNQPLDPDLAEMARIAIAGQVARRIITEAGCGLDESTLQQQLLGTPPEADQGFDDEYEQY